MSGYVASSVIQNTNQCQTPSFLGEKLKFDEHNERWGTILGPLHCTWDPKTPQKQMIHGEKFYFRFHSRGARA